MQSRLTHTLLKFLTFLLNTKLYLSLGAVFLTLETQVQLGMKPQWHPYLFIVFLGTMCAYNFHQFITILTHKKNLDSEEQGWVRKNEKWFNTLVLASVVGFLVAVFMAKREVIIGLVPMAVITLFYSVPVFRTYRFRDIPYLKIFLIAFVWAATTVIVPIAQSGYLVSTFQTSLLIAERFLFVFAATIPFDIRDMETDKQEGLKTIPSWLGEQMSHTISYVAVIAFIIVSLFHFRQSFSLALPLFLSGLITLVILYSPRLRRLPFYHIALLDGTIWVQSGLVLVFYYFSNR